MHSFNVTDFINMQIRTLTQLYSEILIPEHPKYEQCETQQGLEWLGVNNFKWKQPINVACYMSVEIDCSGGAEDNVLTRKPHCLDLSMVYLLQAHSVDD